MSVQFHALAIIILYIDSICGIHKKFNNNFAKFTCYFSQSVLYLFCKACFARGGVLLKTKIKELRKEKKLSQEELALAVRTTRQTITSIETGKYIASLPLAYKIAHYFGLTIEEVFDLSDYLDCED